LAATKVFLDKDVMDRQIVDRNGNKTGKVDALRLELRGTEPPVVLGIETRNGALARRAGGLTERLCAWFRTAAQGQRGEDEVKFIEWQRVTRIDVVLHADVDRTVDNFLTTERAVWECWIRPVARISRKRV
jgi:hypothetical protein